MTPDVTRLAAYEYEVPEVERGYTNQTLYVDLGRNEIRAKEVTGDMKELFVGGRGFDLWLLWHAFPRDEAIAWNDPRNALCISSGPLGGTTNFPGSGKSIVACISPLTGIPIDSNVGGYFGPYLKFSGWDALEVQGKADNDVVIYVDGDQGQVQILDIPGLPDDSHLLADQLTELFADGDPKSVSVVSAGSGADTCYFGCLNFSWYDPQRQAVRYKQAGRGGTGTVFRDKNVKALVVKHTGVSPMSNNPADPELLKEIGKKHTKEIVQLDPKQNRMAVVGTTHLVPIMNEYDLLPTNNYRYGRHEDADQIGEAKYEELFDRGFDGCWRGCTVACSHLIKNFELTSGPYKGETVYVDGPEYETIAGCGSNCGIFDPYHIAEMNFYCDTYGLDTISVGTTTAFIMELYEIGEIDDDVTGGLQLTFGNQKAALELLHQMAQGRGFGKHAGRGIRYLKQYLSDQGVDPCLMEDIGMEAKGLEYSEYITKESLAQQGGYGLALKGPQHDEAWLIFLDMVHGYLPSFEDKAEALHWFPMWRTWFGLNGLCKLPWNDIVPENNEETEEPAKVMEHVRNYATFFKAVTGWDVEPDDLILQSERVYTFQRVFNLRMGQGTRKHDSIPYRSVGPVTPDEYESRMERYDGQLEELGHDISGKTTEEKLAMLREHREEQYETLMDAVYKRRGWNENGVPTIDHLRELGIDYPEVIEVVKPYQ
ncbi:MAG: aldehyde ferredoxin oxidoreductase C-terminal domain-containing protein [Thermoplasmatota archaeon]